MRIRTSIELWWINYKKSLIKHIKTLKKYDISGWVIAILMAYSGLYLYFGSLPEASHIYLPCPERIDLTQNVDLVIRNFGGSSTVYSAFIQTENFTCEGGREVYSTETHCDTGNYYIQKGGVEIPTTFTVNVKGKTPSNENPTRGSFDLKYQYQLYYFLPLSIFRFPVDRHIMHCEYYLDENITPRQRYILDHKKSWSL